MASDAQRRDDCPRCDGEGVVYDPDAIVDAILCPFCAGTGFDPATDDRYTVFDRYYHRLMRLTADLARATARAERAEAAWRALAVAAWMILESEAMHEGHVSAAEIREAFCAVRDDDLFGPDPSPDSGQAAGQAAGGES